MEASLSRRGDGGPAGTKLDSLKSATLSQVTRSVLRSAAVETQLLRLPLMP
jgi:hypothetical protein